MKLYHIMRTIMIIFVSFFGTLSFGQSIERQVIAAAGLTLTDGATASIDFTVGELVVTTITDGSTATLTQGFHQGEIQLSINLAATAYLQGAIIDGTGGLMRDDLRTNNLIPLTSPYSDGLIADASVLTPVGTDAIVDWVFVELRDATDNTAILYSQSALLQRDGDVVAIDGASALNFAAPTNSYYVVIKHRNHLGVMTASTVALSSTVAIVDFTDANNQITFGANAQTTSGMPSGVIGMWGGDADGTGTVQYSGTNPESTSILSYVLNSPSNFLGLPSFPISGYSDNDVNMDGQTQYTGSTPELPFILQNVLSNPGNFLNLPSWPIEEQLPSSMGRIMRTRTQFEEQRVRNQ